MIPKKDKNLNYKKIQLIWLLYTLAHLMSPQMTFHSRLPFLFKITAINWTEIVTIGAVLVEKISVYKFYLTNDAGEGLGMHPVRVNEKLGNASNPSHPTVRTGQT